MCYGSSASVPASDSEAGSHVCTEGAEGFGVSATDEALVREVLEASRAAARATSAAGSDVPVAALVVDASGAVIGRGSNLREAEGDPTAHAEVEALRAAGRARGAWRLDGCTLVVTLEPCAMCAGAAVAARVDRIVFGAWDSKAGACGSVWDLPRDPRSLHRVETVGGVLAEQCAEVLRGFFAQRRV